MRGPAAADQQEHPVAGAQGRGPQPRAGLAARVPGDHRGGSHRRARGLLRPVLDHAQLRGPGPHGCHARGRRAQPRDRRARPGPRGRLGRAVRDEHVRDVRRRRALGHPRGPARQVRGQRWRGDRAPGAARGRGVLPAPGPPRQLRARRGRMRTAHQGPGPALRPHGTQRALHGALRVHPGGSAVVGAAQRGRHRGARRTRRGRTDHRAAGGPAIRRCRDRGAHGARGRPQVQLRARGHPAGGRHSPLRPAHAQPHRRTDREDGPPHGAHRGEER